MSWRTVIISRRAKLDLKLNCLVVRGETVNRIVLSEIGLLLIENTAISLTAALLAELVKRKIKVIFCDEKRNPLAELSAYYGSHDCSLKICDQISWYAETKGAIWIAIVCEKIRRQQALLHYYQKPEAAMLEQYIQQVEYRDASNREGHAAKVYFNALFGMDFTRKSENVTNAALNYGYSILLSAFNRAIVANGYLTQLGLHHENRFNPFNFSSDLMEPFRPLVDARVLKMDLNIFTTEEKHQLVDLLNCEVRICRQRQALMNAIGIYCKSICDALASNDVSCLQFCDYEF